MSVRIIIRPTTVPYQFRSWELSNSSFDRTDLFQQFFYRNCSLSTVLWRERIVCWLFFLYFPSIYVLLIRSFFVFPSISTNWYTETDRLFYWLHVWTTWINNMLFKTQNDSRTLIINSNQFGSSFRNMRCCKKTNPKKIVLCFFIYGLD